MRCSTFLDRYDLLDSGEEPGFLLRSHMAFCPECRRQVSLLADGMHAWIEADAKDPQSRIHGNLVDQRVMAAISLLPRPRKELHARNWAVSGTVLLLSMVLIPFSKDFQFLREVFGEGYSLPLFLVLGIVLTLFGLVFIATHIEELEPYVRRHLGNEPRT